MNKHTQQSFINLLVSAINANTRIGLQEAIAAKPNMKDVDGDVASYAAARGRSEMLEVVLPIVSDNGRLRAFYVAATYGQIQCAQMLLPVVAGHLDRSLKLAVEHQQVAMVEWLLNNGTYGDGLLQGMCQLYNRPHDREIFSLLYKHGGRTAVNSLVWAHTQMWGNQQQTLIQWADEEDAVAQNQHLTHAVNTNVGGTVHSAPNRLARKI